MNCPNCKEPMGQAPVCIACGYNSNPLAGMGVQGVPDGELLLYVKCCHAIGNMIDTITQSGHRELCWSLVGDALANAPIRDPKRVRFRDILHRVMLVVPKSFAGEGHIVLAMANPDGAKAREVIALPLQPIELPDSPSIYPHDLLDTWLLHPHVLPCKCPPRYMHGGVCAACKGTKEVKSLFGHMDLYGKIMADARDEI